jgi:hypothetical protein
MALSLRRANAVKDALVRDGVPAQAITVIGKSESQRLVPTGDGVRELQNRRVEIVAQEEQGSVPAARQSHVHSGGHTPICRRLHLAVSTMGPAAVTIDVTRSARAGHFSFACNLSATVA